MHPDDKKSQKELVGCITASIGCLTIIAFNLLFLAAVLGGAVYFFKEVLQ